MKLKDINIKDILILYLIVIMLGISAIMMMLLSYHFIPILMINFLWYSSIFLSIKLYFKFKKEV